MNNLYVYTIYYKAQSVGIGLDIDFEKIRTYSHRTHFCLVVCSRRPLEAHKVRNRKT